MDEVFVAVLGCKRNAGKTALKEVCIDTREMIVALIIKINEYPASLPSCQESRLIFGIAGLGDVPHITFHYIICQTSVDNIFCPSEMIKTKLYGAGIYP
jgi:hypothetical protein